MALTENDVTRARIVQIARAEIGAGRVKEYWADVLGPKAKEPYPKHWCGAFALWCLHQAGLALNVQWVIRLGFLEVQRLPKTRQPKPGDIAYFDRPFQHHAVVERAATDGLYTIDGNQGGLYPVDEKRRSWSTPVVFYSIEPFLKATHAPPRIPVPPAQKRVVIKEGDKGEGVREAQYLINKAKLGLTLKEDGSFGPLTANAVKVFQTSRHLSVTGVIDQFTWAELDKLK